MTFRNACFAMTAVFCSVPFSAQAQSGAAECSALYYEQVPIAFARMMQRDGKWLGLAEIQSNKEKDNWNRFCAIKIVLATDKGVELDNIAANCSGSKGEEYCRIATQSGKTTLAPGKYKITLHSPADALLLEQPFEVVQWDASARAVRGDWENLAAFIQKPDGAIGLRIYLTNAAKADGEKMEKLLEKVDWTLQVAVKHKGKQIASGSLRENFRHRGTEGKDVVLSFEPVPGVQKPFTMDSLKGLDGDAEVTVSLGKTVLKHYRFKLGEDGIQPHERQAVDYPRKAQALATLWPKADKMGKPANRFFWIETK